MKAFWKLAGVSLQSRMYYRTNFLINLLTPLFVLGGQFLLYSSLFRLQDGAPLGGFAPGEMYAYLLLAFCINNLLSWSSENSLSQDIRSGAVVSRCLRPAPFLVQSLAEMWGSLVPQAAVNGCITALAFLLFAPRVAPPDLGMLPLFLCSLVLAVALRMLLISLFSLLCFYTTGHLGLAWTRTALTEFFSGALIPVALFPLWLRQISYATPFPLMLQAPISLFLGQPLPMGVPGTFALQLGWICLFVLLHQLLYGHIRRNITLAGG